MDFSALAGDPVFPGPEDAKPEDWTNSEKFIDLVIAVHERIIDEIESVDLRKLSVQDRKELAARVAVELAHERNIPLTSVLRQMVAREAEAEVSGYGPIQALIDDPTVTEVMVNGPLSIYVERAGKLYKEKRVFKDNAHVMRIIERIVQALGRRVDESSPMVDARLPDGSRVNAIIPPLAIDGPTLTVRKFSREPFTAEKLVEFGTMSAQMLAFLRAAVEAKLTIMISGGTGSGKTTTLNALSGFIPRNERIVTIEDAAELQLQQDHVVRLECRPSNIEGRGEITVRQLVRNALRMRPDRIIVGEVRGAEALDMLQAMNTGHEGSLSTAHANSPRDALSRVETMVLMAGTELPSRAIREQITSAIDMIVHQARLRDGTRRITEITEVQHMQGDVITLQDVFIFDQKGVDPMGKVLGEHTPTGLRPSFMERLEKEGIDLPVDLFGSSRWKRR